MFQESRYKSYIRFVADADAFVRKSYTPLLLIGGDTAPVGSASELLQEEGGSLVFGGLADLFKRTSLTLVNQECPLVTKPTPIIKCGPKLAAPVGVAKGLAAGGIDAVILANNHIMDHGDAGLESTVSSFESVGIRSIGLTTPCAHKPCVNHFTVKGRKISVLALAEHEFNWDTDYHRLPNPLRPGEDTLTVSSAAKKCDLLVIVIHGGPENYPYPSPRMVANYRALAEAGADAVIGCHSHCMMGSEIHKGVPIVYGLGNLLFDKPGASDNVGPHWNHGLLASITFEGDEELQVKLIPVTQDPGASGVDFSRQSISENMAQYHKTISKPIQDWKELKYLWEVFCAAQTPHLVRELMKGILAITPGVLSERLAAYGFFPRLRLFPRRFQQGIALLRGFAWCENHREEWATVTEMARKGCWAARYRERDKVIPSGFEQ